MWSGAGRKGASLTGVRGTGTGVFFFLVGDRQRGGAGGRDGRLASLRTAGRLGRRYFRFRDTIASLGAIAGRLSNGANQAL